MALSRHARRKLGKERLLERECGATSGTPRVHVVGSAPRTGDGWRQGNELHIATGSVAHYRTGEIAREFQEESRR